MTEGLRPFGCGATIIAHGSRTFDVRSCYDFARAIQCRSPDIVTHCQGLTAGGNGIATKRHTILAGSFYAHASSQRILPFGTIVVVVAVGILIGTLDTVIMRLSGLQLVSNSK